MNKKLLSMLALSALLLTACSEFMLKPGQSNDPDAQTEDMTIEDNDPSNDDDDMIEDDEDVVEDDESVLEGETEANAVYTAYTPAALTDGETKVLFFHAAWCPVCRDADAKLTSWYNAGGPALPTYRVNYDTETELKSKYGVTYQHTYVLVDGQGNEITSLQGPTEDQLKMLVGA